MHFISLLFFAVSFLLFILCWCIVVSRAVMCFYKSFSVRSQLCCCFLPSLIHMKGYKSEHIVFYVSVCPLVFLAVCHLLRYSLTRQFAIVFLDIIKCFVLLQFYTNVYMKSASPHFTDRHAHTRQMCGNRAKRAKKDIFS